MSNSDFGSSRERSPKMESLLQTIDTIIENVRDRLERQGVPEFQTYLDPIDGGLHGLHGGQLTTIAARPGCGKTSFGCQIAYKLSSAGKSVVFLSLEMSRETILERIFCQLTRVDSFKLLCGDVDGTVIDQLHDFKTICKELPLTIIDDYGHTSTELFKLFEHLECRPQVLILDHIQHIRATDSRRSDREHINDYLRYLKEFAIKYKIAIVVLSQINREGTDEPTIASLKGSGTIEEISDHVLLIHMEQADEVLRKTSIRIAKNRFGPIGSYMLNYEAPYCLFKNIPVAPANWADISR